jgi:hypothetical protein
MLTTRRAVLLTPLVLAAAIAANALGTRSVVNAANTKSLCQVANDWAVSNRANLPTTLNGFSEHELAYRKAIYNLITIEQRRELWREHLTSFLGPASRLTAGQQEVLQGAIARLDEYVDLPAKAQAAIKRDGLTPQRLRTLFGDSLAVAIFATLGPPAERSRVATAVDGAVATLTGKTDSPQGGDCECSTESDWCVGSSCRPLPCMYKLGCGTFWCHICDGLCSAASNHEDE